MYQQTEDNTLISAEGASFVDHGFDFDSSKDDLTLDPADLLLTETDSLMFCSPMSRAFGAIDSRASGCHRMLATYDCSQSSYHLYDPSDYSSGYSAHIEGQSSGWYGMLATTHTSQNSDPPYDLSSHSSGASTNTSPLDLSLSFEPLRFPEPLPQFFFELESWALGADQVMLDQQQGTISDSGASMEQTTDTPASTDQQVNRLPNKASSTTRPRRRWPCVACPMVLTAKRDLQRHINDIHPQKAMEMNIYKPRVACQFCPRTFSRFYNLQRHQKNPNSCRRRTASRVLKPK